MISFYKILELQSDVEWQKKKHNSGGLETEQERWVAGLTGYKGARGSIGGWWIYISTVFIMVTASLLLIYVKTDQMVQVKCVWILIYH